MMQSTAPTTAPTRLPIGSLAVIAVLVVVAVLVGQALEWANGVIRNIFSDAPLAVS